MSLPRVLLPPIGLAAALAVLAALSGIAAASGVPLAWVEVAAGVALMLVAAATIPLAWENGLVLLAILAPYFLTDSDNGAVWLLEAIAWGTALCGLARFGDESRRVAAVPAALFLAATALAAAPFDLPATLLELRFAPTADLFEGLSETRSGVRWFRVVADTVVGAILLALVARRRWSREEIDRLAAALAASATFSLVVAAVGYLVRQDSGLPFLGASLGWQKSHEVAAFAGLASNVGYFALWSWLTFPWLAFALERRLPPVWRWAAGIGLVGLVPALVGTHQRGAVGLLVLLGVILAAATLLRRRRVDGEAAGGGLPVGRLFAAGLVLAALLLAATPAGRLLMTRFDQASARGDWLRPYLLGVAGRMVAEHPVLGVGTGRFDAAYELFGGGASFRFGTWSAHNLFAQVAAERGLLGLAALLGLLAAVLVPALRKVRRNEPGGEPLRFFLAGLGAFLVHSLFLETFQVRAIQLLAMITLGFVAALSADDPPPDAPKRERGVPVLLLLVLLASLVRVSTILAQPATPGFEAGFHLLEAGEERWTSARAATLVRVDGTTLRLLVSHPAASELPSPPGLEIRVDGELVRTETGFDRYWRTVDVPVGSEPGTVIHLDLRATVPFRPADVGLGADRRVLGVRLLPLSWY